MPLRQFFAQKSSGSEEPLHHIHFFLVLPDPASHRYTVGVSADISTASVSLTGSVFVSILYQSRGAIDEEFLNTPKRNYVQKENAAESGVCEFC